VVTTEVETKWSDMAHISVPALYSAQVTHTRRTPIANQFQYDASYWLVDYDQLPQPIGLKGHLACVDASDHSDIRALLTEHDIAAERILMLAMARTLGYVFNPISVFWCYDASAAAVAVVVEVHNTYGGRHAYVLRPDEKGQARVDKALYVSPFYAVDGFYDIRVSDPGPAVSVTVTLHPDDGAPFVATLRGQRTTPNLVNVLRSSLTKPAIRVALLIRWQAVRLWVRGLEVQSR
jgi:DUF1365 family protein